MSSSKGSILVIALWATTALAALGIMQSSRVSLQLKWTQRLQELHQAGYLAYAGLEVAQIRLSTIDPATDSQNWDAAKESWAKPLESPISISGGTISYLIKDEQARIPINSLPRIQAVLNQPPLAIDIYDQLHIPPEAAAALSARLAQQPPKPIRHLAELLTLPQMTPERVADLEPLVTAHGTGPININTVSKDVLTRLGFSSALADQITITFRQGPGPDQATGTLDDGVFEEAGQIQPVLSDSFGPLNPQDQSILTALVGSQPILLDVHSVFFRVNSSGQSQRNQMSGNIWAVLKRSGQAGLFEIEEWYES